MKCPLKAVAFGYTLKVAEWSAPDCLKEECAWWEDKLGKCSIRRIWIALQDIHEVLHDIEKKMPHAGQFTR